jgi:hypothetical protein
MILQIKYRPVSEFLKGYFGKSKRNHARFFHRLLEKIPAKNTCPIYRGLYSGQFGSLRARDILILLAGTFYGCIECLSGDNQSAGDKREHFCKYWSPTLFSIIQ